VKGVKKNRNPQEREKFEKVVRGVLWHIKSDGGTRYNPGKRRKRGGRGTANKYLCGKFGCWLATSFIKCMDLRLKQQVGKGWPEERNTTWG